MTVFVFAELVVGLHVARFIWESWEDFKHPQTPGAVYSDFGLPFSAGFLNVVASKRALTGVWLESFSWFVVIFILAFIGCGLKVYFADVRGKPGGWKGVRKPEIVHTLEFGLTFAVMLFLLVLAITVRQPAVYFWIAIGLIAVWALGVFLFDPIRNNRKKAMVAKKTAPAS
jgi:xanthine/uracil permease